MTTPSSRRAPILSGAILPAASLVASLVAGLVALPATGQSEAQDVLLLAGPPSPVTAGVPVPVTVSLRDLAGTPLGVDQGGANRVQAFAVAVRFSPPGAVASAVVVRSGVTAAATPIFESTVGGTDSLTWIGSFNETANPLAFTQPPAAEGDPFLTLRLSLAPTLPAGAVVTVSFDPVETSLSNRGGTVSEAESDGRLLLGPAVTVATATLGRKFYTVIPCRLIDSRDDPRPGFLPGARRDFLATASCGVSATARAIALNVTVVYPTAAGYLTLFAGDAPTPPVTSTINFGKGQVRANNGVVPLGADGTLGIVNGSTGTTDVVVDVVGFFE